MTAALSPYGCARPGACAAAVQALVILPRRMTTGWMVMRTHASDCCPPCSSPRRMHVGCWCCPWGYGVCHCLLLRWAPRSHYFDFSIGWLSPLRFRQLHHAPRIGSRRRKTPGARASSCITQRGQGSLGVAACRSAHMAERSRCARVEIRAGGRVDFACSCWLWPRFGWAHLDQSGV